MKIKAPARIILMADAAVLQTDHSKAKVFISYSRKDLAFADCLDSALKTRGFEPLIDRTDIYAFEEWWKRVEALIGRADTVVFVLSPDAVRPESVARKEVAFAASLNKRFAPIVFRPVEDKLVPEAGATLGTGEGRLWAFAALAGAGASGAVDCFEATRSTCAHRGDPGVHQTEPSGGHAPAQRPHG